MGRPKLSIEDILKLPYRKIKEIAQEHRDAFANRDYGNIGDIAHLHVMELKLGQKYYDFFNQVLIESLKEEAGKRTLDGSIIRLLREYPGGLPTFQVFKRDKMTATSMHGEGNIFEVYSVLSKEIIAKTFATIFYDSKKFKRAHSAYNFTEHIKESIEADYNDEDNADHVFARNIVKRLRPVKPKYGNNNILGVTFVNANDLHDEAAIKGLDVDQRIQYLKEVSDIYLAMAVFGDKYRGFLRKGFAKRIFGRNDIKGEDHKTAFVNRFYGGIGIDIPKDFNALMKKYVFDELEKEKKRFAKGDCLPSNEMVQHDAAVGKNSGSDRVYSPIDFEFACFDAVQASLVQLWTKFGIFDHRGQSLKTKEGKEAEKELLGHSYDTLIRLLNVSGQTKEAETYSRERFEKIYNLIKIENGLIWARRYYGHSKNPQIDNPEESMLNARYYFSLAAREMVRQGMIKDENDPVLKPLAGRFGAPLKDRSDDENEITLEYIARRFDPHARIVSFLKSDTILDPQREIEKMVKSFRKKGRKERYRTIGKVAVAFGVLAGLVYADFAINKTKREKDELSRKVDILGWMPVFRYVYNSSIYGSEGILNYGTYSKYEKVFQDKETAMAACLNLKAVYEAAEASGIKIDYGAIEKYDGMKKSPVPYKKIRKYICEYYQNIDTALIEARDYADFYMTGRGSQDYIEGKIKEKSEKARNELEEKKRQDIAKEKWGVPNPRMGVK